MTARFRCAIAAVLVSQLVGCGTGGTPSPVPAASDQPRRYLSEADRSAGQALQRKLMSDGTVTQQDYEEAIDGVKHCLAKHGVKLVSHNWNPVNRRQIDVMYGNEAMPDDQVTGYGDACAEAYVNDVSKDYARKTESVMAKELMLSVQKCLPAHGLRATGTEKNMADLIRSTKNEKLVMDCIREGAQQLYPDIFVPLQP